ncbi:MAG: hypothetical protein COS95_05730 [Ignavibacteriales bacterium CG07_land_8_20_14_0_80_59_12]|jgi:uncharacterized GH25 family protein|nr:MAG: hypothetical protein COS95_05730 [Ignavibacteriales bacterium CG07_land_8_20_14_0_80_59_12]
MKEKEVSDMPRGNRTGPHLLLTALLVTALTGSSFAHTLWLNVTDYRPSIGGQTKLYFGWGHRYPVDDFLALDKLAEFILLEPGGNRRTLQPNPGGFLATEVSFSKAGIYITAAALKPGFYTMYVEKGKVRHRSASKEGISGVIVSVYFEEYAKALIEVEAPQDSSYRQSVGHKLEIIPLENPAQLRVGDFLAVKVLFEGKPCPFSSIYATYAGFSTGEDYAYATTTGMDGVARIRILHHGPWLLKAESKQPAPDDLRGKCNELLFQASLTFEAP